VRTQTIRLMVSNDFVFAKPISKEIESGLEIFAPAARGQKFQSKTNLILGGFIQSTFI
jgi:hypothetical protein